MRALLAGGAGFIGSHLAEALLRRGDEVLIVDNLLTGSTANVELVSSMPGCSFIKADVAEPLRIEQPLDAILHLASAASPPDYYAHPIDTLRAGTFATYYLLELAKIKRAKFLMASTSEVYGDPLENPQREDYWGHVNPVGPRSVYDEAKRCSEAYTMAYARAGLETRIVRIFNTYGPRMRPNDGRAVPNFVSQLLSGQELTVYGDGSQTRSLCYVDDLVAGILKVLESDESRPVNLGNPHEITMLELAKQILAYGDGQNKIEFHELPVDDPKRRCPDITRARALGWEPKVTLEVGLPQTIAWFRSQLARSIR